MDESGGLNGHCSRLNLLSVTDDVAGKIDNILMSNFMCHSNLEVKLNDRINFITGRNGSGKSAIMTALLVVLGGTASLTGRGSNIADFIKKGENLAKVSVTLVNEGIKSFKKELYGSRITICRNISRSGNSYACKSETGQIISKKKEEVDNIVLAFNLQITNPICILNQDVARNFLCSSDSFLRFTMFMKATQLEELKIIHMKTWQELNDTNEELKRKQKGIEETSKEVSRLKEKLKLFASLEKLANERTELQNEFLWSKVVNEEAKLNHLSNRKNQLFGKKEEYLKDDENIEIMKGQLELEINECKIKVEDIKNSRNRDLGKKNFIQKEIQNFEREIEKIESHIKLLNNRKKLLSSEINGVKNYLIQKDALASKSQADKEEASQKINDLNKHLLEIKEDIVSAQRNFDKAQEMKSQRARMLENAKADLGELEQNKKRVELLLANTKGKVRKSILKFGDHTKDILKFIDEAAKKNLFIRKPVGPCGMYVTLTGDPKWGRAVESIIGGLMTTYCCDNQKDFQILNRIMERVCGNRQPQIIISKFLHSRHDVDSQKVSYKGLFSVLDVLKFDNDVVFNTFIDQARIETILLFETDSQAASVLTHIQNVPKNLRMGLTLQSDQYFPAPNYRTYYGDTNRALKYFETSQKEGDSAKKLEGELREINVAIQEKALEIKSAKKNYQEISELFEKSFNDVKQLKHREKNFQLKINQLKDIEDSRPVVKTKVVLEGELQVLENQLVETSKEVSECQESAETKKEKIKELVEQVQGFQDAEDALEARLNLLEETQEKRRFDLRRILKKKEKSQNQVKDIEEKLVSIEEEIRESKVALEKQQEAVVKVCPLRINTERSPEELQKLLEKCEKRLKTAKQSAGDSEATINEYKAKKELFKDMQKKAQLLASEIKALTRVAYSRSERLEILQKHTAGMVHFNFRAILQSRGYDGQLRIDFERKTLDLEVKPKDERIARKDSKTLSGGERSYSTVSFILAIWKVVEMPVYFLDEFDVFMDKINRKVIMDLLLDHANFQSNQQFVFITPQDISSVEVSDSVSVYKLPDPERKM